MRAISRTRSKRLRGRAAWGGVIPVVEHPGWPDTRQLPVWTRLFGEFASTRLWGHSTGRREERAKVASLNILQPSKISKSREVI